MSISEEERRMWRKAANDAAISQTDALAEAFGQDVTDKLRGVLARIVWSDTVSTDDQVILATAIRATTARRLIEADWHEETETWTVYARPSGDADWSRFEGSDLAELLSVARDLTTGG